MMKIAVASTDGNAVAAHTGRCAYFVIFEVVDGHATRIGIRPNSFTDHARGKCHGRHDAAAHPGHHSHGALVNAIGDCCVLVTRGLGPRLVADLAQKGIDAYVCAEASVEEAARQFAAGRLSRAAGVGACTHPGDGSL